MKTLSPVTQAAFASAMTLAFFCAGTVHSQTTVWDVPDPFVGEGGVGGNLSSMLVDASTLTGLPGIADGRDMIGEVLFSGAQQFGNINQVFTFGTDSDAGEIDPALIGTKFQLSIDYYIPSAGGMSAGDDLIYVQLNTNTTNTLDGNSAGFIGNSAESADQWNTITLDYTVLTEINGFPTVDIQAFFIAADGGFGGSPNGDGVTPALYLDNLQLVGGLPNDLLGDFDGNGTIDLADLDQYIGNLDKTTADNSELAALDLDDSGVIDAADFEQHYTTLVETSNGQVGTFAGDLNLDGTVDVLADAAALIENLGQTVTSWEQGDVTGDGTVTVLADAAALVNNLGRTNEPAAVGPSASAVPEPNSLSVLALSGLAATARRRR